jgi:adenine-specific DNA-methyltransferase
MAALLDSIALTSEPTSREAPAVSFVELRAELHAHAETVTERTQVSLAEAICIESIRGYWRSVANKVSLYEPPRAAYALPEVLAIKASRFGEIMAPLPVADASYNLSLLYTRLLRQEWRTKHGVYYTPPALVSRLLDQAEAAGLDWSKAHILDPAAGAAAFLIPAAARLMETMASCEPAVALQNISARVRGYEIDPFAAWMGQVFIEAAILPIIAAANRRPGTFITVCDSLKMELTAEYDLVIGNPPFGKISLPPRQRERFARSLYGHANLYGLFTDLAVKLTRPGGLISFLTPSSFLAGEYFKNLRSVLSREAPPIALDFVSSRKGVFEDVLQETVLATYAREPHTANTQRTCAVSFILPKLGDPAIAEPAGSFTLPAQPCAPWVLPRHADEESLAKRLRSMPHRLADWGYKVSTGPLVWNRHKPQLCDKPGKACIPLIWAECIASNGRFVFRSERRNHKPYFKLAEDDAWLVVDTSCVLLQRTTAKEQSRRLIAAEMPASFVNRHGGVTVENHLNMMVPTVKKPAVSPALLAAFLNSVVADRAFRCLSGSVAVSAYELENLPLPAASDLKRLIKRKLDPKTIETAASKLYAEGDEA